MKIRMHMGFGLFDIGRWLKPTEKILGDRIIHTSPVSGGDIAHAYQIETQHDRFLLKLHDGDDAADMFAAERVGLEAIADTNTIRTPRVIYCGIVESTAFLLMEYVAARQAGTSDYERLGRQLAQLHQTSAERFGWDTDNFIGSLPQENTWQSAWTEFYITKRLMPQFAMARHAGLLSKEEIHGEDVLYHTLGDLLGDVAPSLLHGDLWGGNYLIAKDGTPYLIDPAVYYGHSEVDLAMSRLFGGFGNRFYEAYAEVIPPAPGAGERNDIYQLYYLLVHLNLFGGAYRSGVLRIVKTYFD